MGGDAINEYSDNERGTFQSERYAKQLVCFDGMRFRGRNGYKNVTPTDIDGAIQLDIEDCLILFELKHHGEAPEGQNKTFEWIINHVNKSGSNGIYFIAEHNIPFPNKIYAKNAVVTLFYWNGKWRKPPEHISLYDAINRHIEWLHNRGEKNE